MKVVTVFLLANLVGPICSQMVPISSTSDVFSNKLSQSPNVFGASPQRVSGVKKLMNYNLQVNYVKYQDPKIPNSESPCTDNCTVPTTIISKRSGSSSEDPVSVIESPSTELYVEGLNSRGKRLTKHHSSQRKSTDQDVAGPECPRTDDGKCARGVKENSRKAAAIFLFPERKRRDMIDQSRLHERSVEMRYDPLSSIHSISGVECSRNDDGKCMKVVARDKSNDSSMSAENDMDSSKSLDNDALLMLMRKYVLLILKRGNIRKEYCEHVYFGKLRLIKKCIQSFESIYNKNIKMSQNSLFSRTVLKYLQSNTHIPDKDITKVLKVISSFDVCKSKIGDTSKSFDRKRSNTFSKITDIGILQQLIKCAIDKNGATDLPVPTPDPLRHILQSEENIFIMKRDLPANDAAEPVYPFENSQMKCVNPETGERILDHMCVNSNDKSAPSSRSSFDPSEMEHVMENDLSGETNPDYFGYGPLKYAHHKLNGFHRDIPLRVKSGKVFSTPINIGEENRDISLTRVNSFKGHEITEHRDSPGVSESFSTEPRQHGVSSYVSEQLLSTVENFNDKMNSDTEETWGREHSGIGKGSNGKANKDVVLRPSVHWQEVSTHTKAMYRPGQRMTASSDPYVTRHFRGKRKGNNAVMDFLNIEKSSLIAPENSRRPGWTFRGRVSDSNQSEIVSPDSTNSGNISDNRKSDTSNLAGEFDRKLALSKNQWKRDESHLGVTQESSNKVPVGKIANNQSRENRIITGDTSAMTPNNQVINITAKHSKDSEPLLQNFISGKGLQSTTKPAPNGCPKSDKKCNFKSKQKSVSNKDRYGTSTYNNMRSNRKNNSKIYKDNQNAQARRIANHTSFDSDSESENTSKKRVHKPLEVYHANILNRYRYDIGPNKQYVSHTIGKPSVSHNSDNIPGRRTNNSRFRSSRSNPFSQTVDSSESDTALKNTVNEENGSGENIPFLMDAGAKRDKNDNSPPVDRFPFRTHSTDLLLDYEEE